MKNLINVFALLFCASIIMVACSKVETPNVNGKVTSSGNSTAQSSDGISADKPNTGGLKSASGWGTNWLFDDENIRCLPAPLDCYDVITIKPQQSEIVTTFENAVNGASGEIKIFFTTQQWQLLFPGLDGTEQLTKLQSGNYDMIMKQDANDRYYYAAGSELPLTLQNEEFVLRLDKSAL
jgi:hypothetical protein